MSQQKSCSHLTCQNLAEKRIEHIVVLFFDKRGNKNAKNVPMILNTLLCPAEERGVDTVCSGKLEPCDSGCYLKTVIRKSKQSHGIDAKPTLGDNNRENWSKFDKIFRKKNDGDDFTHLTVDGNIRCVTGNVNGKNRAIFVGFVPKLKDLEKNDKTKLIRVHVAESEYECGIVFDCKNGQFVQPFATDSVRKAIKCDKIPKQPKRS